MNKPPKAYPVADSTPRRPPSFGRVMRTLSDSDIDDEIEQGRGDPDYQEALRAERARRKEQDDE